MHQFTLKHPKARESLGSTHVPVPTLFVRYHSLVLDVWLEDRIRSNKRLMTVLQSKVLLLFRLKLNEVLQKKTCDVIDDDF